MSAFRVGQKVDLQPAKVRHGKDRPATICECGDHAFAPLTRGFSTIVSPQDIGVFNRKWAVKFHRRHATAVRILHPERTAQVMSRLIAGAVEGEYVDHINGDPLDNRRQNLRICSQAQNSWNRGASRGKASGLPKGVFRKRNKFSAALMKLGKTYRLGVFDTPEAAAYAYSKAATELHGEFARSE